jgi:hypothetical protein
MVDNGPITFHAQKLTAETQVVSLRFTPGRAPVADLVALPLSTSLENHGSGDVGTGFGWNLGLTAADAVPGAALAQLRPGERSRESRKPQGTLLSRSSMMATRWRPRRRES